MLRLYENQGRLTFFHPANGGSRHPAEAAALQRLGVRAGVPDLVVLIIGVHKICTAFIEMKAPKTDTSKAGRASQVQDGWGDWLKSHGFEYRVCTTVDEVKTYIDILLNIY